MIEDRGLSWIEQLKEKKERAKRAVEILKRQEAEREAKVSIAFRPFFAAVLAAVQRDIVEMAAVFPAQEYRFRVIDSSAEAFNIERARPWPVGACILADLNRSFLQLKFSGHGPADRSATIKLVGARVLLDDNSIAIEFDGRRHTTADSFAESILKSLLKQAELAV